MNIKKIASFAGLGIVAALIICVLVLALMPTKIMPTFDSAKPDEIKIWTSENQSYIITNNEASKTEYDGIYNEINSLGSYSILDTLFMGIMGQTYQVQSTATSKNLTTLQGENDFVIQLQWSESQYLTNADGSKYDKASSSQSKFKKALIGISNVSGAAQLNIYLYLEHTSSTSYYSYVAYANTQNLYNYCNGLEDNLFA